MKNRALKVINVFLLSALSVLFVVLAVFGTIKSPVVYAAESLEVLRDLRRDKNFNESNYPYVKNDYGLYVIQIGESSNKELFVYVYQPCHDTYDLLGTKISISYGYSVDGAGLKPHLYNLKLVSTSGTLDKYYVEGFTIPNDGDRYYNIVEIFRMVNTEIDEVDEQFPKTDIAYSVGQQWYVCDLNDSKHYEMNTFKTLNVDTVFNSSVRVSNGFTFSTLLAIPESCDIWFYCFNVADYVVKHVYDGDLSYSMDYIQKGINWGFTQDEDVTNICKNEVLTLRDTDIMSYKGNGLGAREFSWRRIMSSSDFVETIEDQVGNFSESDKERILSSQWVFTYLETSYSEVLTMGAKKYYNVYDVGLLRLYFQDIYGKKYDLGVVNDLSDPSDIPSIVDGLHIEEIFEDFVKIVFVILAVILIVLLLNFVTPIKSILKFIFKAIGFVVALPFKLIKKLFKKSG